MKIIPLKNFLGKPMQLKTGNVYYEKELDEAIKKYEAQFQHSANTPDSESLGNDFERWLKKNKWEKVKAMYSQPIGENGDGVMEYAHKYINQLEREFKLEHKRGKCEHCGCPEGIHKTDCTFMAKV